MRIVDMFKRAARSLLSAKARTLLTAFAIAVGAFALTLTLGASNGAQSYADNLVNDNFDPSQLIVTADGNVFDAATSDKPQEYSPNFGTITSGTGSAIQVKMLNDSDIKRLQAIPGVSSVQPISTVGLQYVTRDGMRQYTASAQSIDSMSLPDILVGNASTLKNGSIIIPEGFITSLGFNNAQDAIGKSVRIGVQKQADPTSLIASFLNGEKPTATPATSEERTFTIVAVSKKPGVLLQPGTALNLTINQHDLTELNDFATSGTANFHKYLSATAQVANGKDTAQLQVVQMQIQKAGYGAQSIADTQKIIGQVIGVLQGIVTVFGLIAVIASVFGVVNTMYISVLQRTREIGLMKALGMHKKDINTLFLFEAGFIGFLGGLLGSALAILLGIALNPFISRQLDLGDASLLQFHPIQIIGLLVILTLIAVAAGVFPARKAARLDPIAALRTE